jgi:hypothetical protein
MGTLQDPAKIGRHEPDALARGLGGTLVIGEAKLGEDLKTEHTLEQLHDFTHHFDEQSGEIATLVLIVPKGFEPKATEALMAAAADSDRVTVYAQAIPGEATTAEPSEPMPE